ncbi:helix-turn-helix domain-containing protein [Halococcus thailandensis]|uniref:Bacterio-opsin activator HTH domain-containing protein n=1 Tax=Halococcus thailandensis JCM 13552 TaxID=1227457 RepID=M0NGF3_9EURY|nr:helix-turn-helix domain-containing protein [Halococcus thailandensis]EMA56184.1 Bacterio-opsin activator HTH domain-containing protein [Halococcus thailandensis JCM 13552]
MKTSDQPEEALDEEQKTDCIIVYTIETPSYLDLLNEVPQIQLTLKQMVACDPETVLLTFWAENGDPDTIENILQESELLSDVAILDNQNNGQTLYQVQLPAKKTTYWKWTELKGVLLDGVGTQKGWTIRMRFPTREAVFAYRDYCEEQEIPFRLKSIKTDNVPRENDLTAAQFQVLEAAVQGGYFNIPRDTSIAELATRFDISDQAASERLRRALSNVLTNHSSLEHRVQ